MFLKNRLKGPYICFGFQKNHHQRVTELYFSKYVHALVYQHTQCNAWTYFEKYNSVTP
jgi:hypothetical protein